MIYNNFGLVAPDIVEHVHHNLGGLVPDQFVISLVVARSAQIDKEQEQSPKRTSENAGAAIFLYFFHSSPSEAMMFFPKTANTPYNSMGLGNLAREVVTSCAPRVA
jgi:hypothetical protein